MANKSKTVIEVAFAFLAIWFALLAETTVEDLVKAVSPLFLEEGEIVKDDKWINDVVVVAHATFITLLATIVVSIYRFIWRLLPWSGYYGGFWIYALMSYDDCDKVKIPIVGFFNLKQKDDEVDEASSWDYTPWKDKRKVQKRGDWEGDYVYMSRRKFSIKFVVNTEKKEKTSSSIPGAWWLRKQSIKPIVGSSVWYGKFVDSKEHRDRNGYVYAERLKLAHFKNQGNADRLILTGNDAERIRKEFHDKLKHLTPASARDNWQFFDSPEQT